MRSGLRALDMDRFAVMVAYFSRTGMQLGEATCKLAEKMELAAISTVPSVFANLDMDKERD